MPTAQRILSDIYRDSVALMRLSADLADLPGVTQASAIMATEANIRLLFEAGLIEQMSGAAPSDLLIAIEGEDEGSVAAALDRAEALLNNAPPQATGGPDEIRAPRSMEMALDGFPDADLALISCPGEYAAAEATKAVRLGLDVMIFSDNVAIAEELALKQLAAKTDRLVMGPDCGSAIINGVPLGFANVVAPGDIGIVAASGTGLQQVSCLIDHLGRGVSQAIGTGGRDLNAMIDGATMLQGLNILADDEQTAVIVLISKPPAAEVAARIQARAAGCGKPVVISFLGSDAGAPQSGNISIAKTLEQAAHMAVDLSKGVDPSGRMLPRHGLGAPEIRDLISTLSDGQQYMRGLYSGGTFSYEAMLLLEKDIGAVNSPSPIKAKNKLNDIWSSTGNTVLDLGDDQFTRGRPHPMIDHRLRNDRILQEARDPETAVILLDVVIGHGSHPAPAEAMAAAINSAREAANEIGHHPIFITFVCGTKADPQNLVRQQDALRRAGAVVVENNAQAARLAGDIISGL
ncbi:MAG: acyl-CoA synthetase FdrA [Proteobacteria bacterium]|nr:acyl-CoA synthetase FdrA [Pseudomonadota bacterium]